MLSSIVQPFGTMVIGLDLARRVMRATQGFRSLRPLMRDLTAVDPSPESPLAWRGVQAVGARLPTSVSIVYNWDRT